MNTDPAGISHCWETTKLLRAWDQSVQIEAMMNAADLIPNLVQSTTVRRGLDPDNATDIPDAAEDDSAHEGEALLAHDIAEEEWETWCNWD